MKEYEIVCVDDETELLELYELELENLGYKITCFSEPLQAFEYIKEHNNKIVSVLSDYRMPEINGLELRKMIIDEDLIVPFIMVTGFYSKEMAITGMELKIEKFVQKPFSSDELLDCVSRVAKKQESIIDEESEMIRSFVDESYPMLEEIEDLILVLEDEPQNINALNTYFRLLHTIKGTASCVGLKSLPDFTHKYEDLVSQLKDGNLTVDNKIIDIFLKGLDILKKMYISISSGERFEFDIQDDLKIFNFSQVVEESSLDDTLIKEVLVQEKSTKIEDEKLSVQVSLLDNFMELSGEITVLRNMILKSVSKIEQKYTGDRDIDVLSEALDEMHKVSSQLQGEISEMRKVSVESIYRPLKRIVRDASKTLNKNVEILFEGDKLRIDTSVGKVLSNTLVHMIRNGVDHGIEKPDVRLASGKEEKGTITVSTSIDTENINVEITDNGNGLNKEMLKAKALEKGLYTEEQLEKMSDQKVYSIIFESGFSTAQAVTDISGRGVGMDMVRSSIENIGGKILIDSELGKGSKFVMVMPIPRSVLIIKSLMVNSLGQQYAIPLQDVGEVLNLEEKRTVDNIRNIDGKFVFTYHDKLLPIITLSEEFSPGHSNDFKKGNIIIINNEGHSYGIIVDEVLDIEEVVCKKMATQLQNEQSPFQGATLIGDGDMALILDLENLARRSSISCMDAEIEDYKSTSMKESLEFHEYLQFDLYSGKNFCVELNHVDRLEEFCTSSITYTGNIPVVRYRDDFMPIIDLDFCLDFDNSLKFEDNENKFKVLVIDHKGRKFGCLVKDIKDIESSSDEVNGFLSDRDGITGTIYLSERTVSVVNIGYICGSYKEKYNRITIDDKDILIAA